MISGNQQATEQFYVQRFGADDFMKKPFGTRGDGRSENWWRQGGWSCGSRPHRSAVAAELSYGIGRDPDIACPMDQYMATPMILPESSLQQATAERSRDKGRRLLRRCLMPCSHLLGRYRTHANRS